ncbi:MAG: hypothetical protein FE045_02940 [Thermoplasmata archaeon]|nr:MAG: hypothetical protein FE045_02940 [Thermoplasmata archaeon]
MLMYKLNLSLCSIFSAATSYNGNRMAYGIEKRCCMSSSQKYFNVENSYEHNIKEVATEEAIKASSSEPCFCA